MPKRFQALEDLFIVTCKKCYSTKVDLTIDTCGECGDTIHALCRNCGQEYKYHDFKEIEVTY